MLPGALASQRDYGIPASVTIAQAIDESGWGQSGLAMYDHNLFGIKGTGPAGTTSLPTVEYQNGQSVSTVAGFRVYDNVTQSIEDHGQLLANSGYYGQAMAARHNADGFANALTGVYATDPQYGAKLIALMQRYKLYRYDAQPGRTGGSSGRTAPGASAAGGAGAGHGGTTIPGLPGSVQRPPAARRAPSPASRPRPASPAPASRPKPASPAPASRPKPASPAPATSQPAPGSSVPGSPAPAGSVPVSPGPSRSAPSAPAPATSGPASPAPAGGGRGMRAPAAPVTASPRQQAPAGQVVVPGAPESPAGSQPADSRPGASQVHGSRQGRASQAPAASTPVPSTRPVPASPQPDPETAAVQSFTARRLEIPASWQTRRAAAAARAPRTARYQIRIPQPVRTAFLTAARPSLMRAEPLYRDVASHTGMRWELLAACDWMQCEANGRYSPVHGERLGSVNPDGSCYRTRSAALEQCADDLVKLAWEIYRIDPTAPGPMSVRELASVFAAFRWGGLLRAHRTSAMEFPYSVAGLTVGHLNMRWPDIAEPHAPDRPGARFRRPFGAVPVVLSLNYPAVV